MTEPTLQNYFDLAAWAYNSGMKSGTPDSAYTAFAVNGPHFRSQNDFDAYAPNAGFYGAAYSIGTGSDESVVIGFEGTNIEAYARQPQFVYNAVEADLGLYKGQLPNALQLAASFTQSVIQTAEAEGISRDHIYITGHSLGAAEAEYADVKTGLTGVTFGTPGISSNYVPAGSKSNLTDYVERGDPVGNYAYTGKNSPEGSFIYSSLIKHFGATHYLGTSLDAVPLQAAAASWATGTTEGRAVALGVLAAAARKFHPLVSYAKSLGLTDSNVPAGANAINVSQLHSLIAAIEAQGNGGMRNTGAVGASGSTGPTGATGQTGALGSQEVRGVAGSASSQPASVTTQQNADGSTSTTYTGGSYFDGKRYYSFTDTTAADGTPESEVRFRNNGATTIALFTSGQTQASVYYDTFYAEGTASDTFAFQPGHGVDVLNGFQAGGANHDVLSFASSDFHSIAAILHNTTDTSAGVVIHDPTGNGDTVQVTGISKADLVANARQDFKLHG